MAKTTSNPVETYRREQKKKEAKKYRAERQKEKKEKLNSMDPEALKEQLKLLERQMAVKTSTDGPSRKRKQELEDTLRAVVRRKKEMEEEKEEEDGRKKLTDASLRSPMSMTELMQRNREKFENPENSIYYHPTLNPFGAPPPGKPQMYRHMLQPFSPMGLYGNTGHGLPRQKRYPERLQQRKFQDRPPVPRVGDQFQRPQVVKMQQPRAMVRRPGKRPPLPLDAPPPGAIQVPCRPPLPSGAIPVRPPPPPPARTQSAAMVSLPPPSLSQQPRQEILSSLIPPATVAAVDVIHQEAADVDEDKVVAPYLTTDEHDSDDGRTKDEKVIDEDAAERRAQLCSLVPMALRVHRQVRVSPSSATSASSAFARRRAVPAPCTSVPQPAPTMNVAPSFPGCPTPSTTANSSMSKEYDAFIEDLKELL